MTTLKPIIIDPETFLMQHCALPALPQVVVDIQALINSADANVKNISGLIMTDPGLTAQILKIVNSAFYGFRREITDIAFAVAYIGFNEIYNIVLTFSVVDTLIVEEISELDSFWEHSLYCARCAKFLAKKIEPLLNPENIWLGAILHDIGKLVYFKFFPEHYKRIVEISETSGRLYSEVEKDFDIPTSSYLGQLLCSRWNLPNIIKAACESHSIGDIDDAMENDYKKIICSANLVSVLVTEFLSENVKHELLESLMKLLNCSKEDWLTLMGEFYDLKQNSTDSVID